MISCHGILHLSKRFYFISFIKGTVMQIEKQLISGRLRVSKVSWKFLIPAIYL